MGESEIDVDELAERIDEHRIVYEDVGNGTRIRGRAFILEFEESVDPKDFCESIATADEPWQMFGLSTKLADEQTDEDGAVVRGEYWKLVGNLFHVDDENVVGSSKIALEVAPEWARVYVKEECCEYRAAEFVQAVDEEFGIEVSFGGGG